MFTKTDLKKEFRASEKRMDKKFVTRNDVREVVRQELDAVKPDWVREITDSITHALGDKIDKMYVKLDKFLGEITALRTEQTLHSGQHQKINDRLDVVEKHLNIVSPSN